MGNFSKNKEDMQNGTTSSHLCGPGIWAPPEAKPCSPKVVQMQPRNLQWDLAGCNLPLPVRPLAWPPLAPFQPFFPLRLPSPWMDTSGPRHPFCLAAPSYSCSTVGVTFRLSHQWHSMESHSDAPCSCSFSAGAGRQKQRTTSPSPEVRALTGLPSHLFSGRYDLKIY